jgi:hypothetical protein
MQSRLWCLWLSLKHGRNSYNTTPILQRLLPLSCTMGIFHQNWIIMYHLDILRKYCLKKYWSSNVKYFYGMTIYMMKNNYVLYWVVYYLLYDIGHNSFRGLLFNHILNTINAINYCITYSWYSTFHCRPVHDKENPSIFFFNLTTYYLCDIATRDHDIVSRAHHF